MTRTIPRDKSPWRLGRRSGSVALPFICFALLAVALVGCAKARERMEEQRAAQQTPRQPATASPPRAAAPPSQPRGLELLGGQTAFCTNVPFLLNGKDTGAKVAAYLGSYKNGYSPRFGADGEAEVTVGPNQEITVKFHPKTPYKANDAGHDNQYYLYVGLIPPWHQPGGGSFSGCGYEGTDPLPASPAHLHFRGDFMWVSGQSSPPRGSGAGNTLLGGWIGYYFPGGALNVVAIDNFSAGPPANPSSLGQARYVCGPPPPNDWWHDLQWADWWNPSLSDRWFSFDIDMSAAAQKAAQASSAPNCGRNLGTATSVQIKAIFLGPEYGVGNGGTITFVVRNLRAETQ